MGRNDGRLNDQPPKPKPGKIYINPDHMKVDNNMVSTPARNKPSKPKR
jgi:hypothetical protein